MWKAKIKVYDETGTFARLAKKYKVAIQGYMLNTFNKKNNYYFTLVLFLTCTSEIKKKIIQDLTNTKRVNKIEDQGNFIICELKISADLEKTKKASLFYNPEIIQTKPFFIDREGWEELELAAFDRRTLENILKVSEKQYRLKLLHFKEEKIESFGIINLFPELTEKQREILNLAIEKGYYNYPRKTNVKKLARENKIAFSTFQEHLRKAENKLIPFLRKKSN